MPIAIALLAYPAGAYVWLVLAAAGLVYGSLTGRFLPLFAGAAAGLLTLLSFLHTTPTYSALALFVAGLALLNVELRFGGAGAAGVAGFVAVLYGSWWLLAQPSAGPLLSCAARLALALGGTLALALVTFLGWRRATLP